MYIVFFTLFCFISSVVPENSTVVQSNYPWLSLPATPQLPLPRTGQYVRINGNDIWYITYGSSQDIPLLFIHGGLANSNYWGLQVNTLKSKYRCILMDSRGHGRSTLSSNNIITYDLMASDVIALLDHLNILKVNLIGWSDGAIIGLNIAMKYPTRLNSLFAFGANYIPSGLQNSSNSPVLNAYHLRSGFEYYMLNPNGSFVRLLNNLIKMWATSPNWTQNNFKKIPNNLPVWIVDADHEEVVYLDQPNTMSNWILQSGELILPRASHFAVIQDPLFFTTSIETFLTEVKSFN